MRYLMAQIWSTTPTVCVTGDKKFDGNAKVDIDRNQPLRVVRHAETLVLGRFGKGFVRLSIRDLSCAWLKIKGRSSQTDGTICESQ